MQISALEALSYFFMGMPYLVAILLGLALSVLGVLSYSYFQWGTSIIVGMFAIEAIYVVVGGITVGISLFYTDFVLVFVLCIALLRLVLSKNMPKLNTAWFICCLVAAFSLLFGIAVYGSTAGVQARPYFYFFSAALYSMSFAIDATKLKFFLNLTVGLAILILGITVYRWVVFYLPIRELLPPEGSFNDGTVRVVRSMETLVLAQVMVAGLFFVRAANASGLVLARAMLPILFAAVLVLQHRSVWVAALAGVMASMFVLRLRGGSVLGQVFFLVVFSTLMSVSLVMSDNLAAMGGQITNSADTALTGQGTTRERVNSWNEIIKNWAAAGPKSILVGQSFGADTTRYVIDDAGLTRKLTYTAHNMYVQTLSTMGLFGLGSLILAIYFVVVGLYRICLSQSSAPVDQILMVFILMQLVYYIPYGTDYFQSMIFGIAMSYVIGHPVTQARLANTKEKRKRLSRWGYV